MDNQRKAALRKALEELIRFPLEGVLTDQVLGSAFPNMHAGDMTMLIKWRDSMRNSLEHNLLTLDWCPECGGDGEYTTSLDGFSDTYRTIICPKCTPRLESLCAVFLPKE